MTPNLLKGEKTFITLLSIPISLTFAIVLMYFSNITINLISLSGLAVASIVGIVLNAILPGKDTAFAEDPDQKLSSSLGKY